MIRQTNLANTLDLAADKTRYDACAKKLLSYKGIIAWILKCCTKEFAPYSVQYICDNCLRENAEIAAHAVHQDHKGMMNGDCRIEGLNTEENAISENTVYYDVRFRAFLPENDEFVKFIVNLEIQLNDTPGYPLVMRGFYYCARMISEQYGTVFFGEQYGKIQKVYSIWICPDPAQRRRNSIFRYYIAEDEVAGKSYVSFQSYDLMEVLILNLGDAKEESQWKVMDLLNMLFSVTIAPEVKKKRLSDDFSIAMTVELEQEVNDMCNLSQGIVEYGIEQGELKKAKEVFFSLAGMGMTAEKIAEAVQVSVKLVQEWLISEEKAVK